MSTNKPKIKPHTVSIRRKERLIPCDKPNVFLGINELSGGQIKVGLTFGQPFSL